MKTIEKKPQFDKRFLLSIGTIAFFIFIYAFSFTFSKIVSALLICLVIFGPILAIKYIPQMWLKPLVCAICYVPWLVTYQENIWTGLMLMIPVMILTLMADAVGKNYNENYAMLYMSLSTLLTIADVIICIFKYDNTVTDNYVFNRMSFIAVLVIIIMVYLVIVSQKTQKSKGNKDAYTRFMFILVIVACGTDILDFVLTGYDIQGVYYALIWGLYFAVAYISDVEQIKKLIKAKI